MRRSERAGTQRAGGTAAWPAKRAVGTVGIVLLLCAAILSGCAIPRSTRPVLKIGLIAPFEGLGRPLGYEVLYAVKLAVRERNGLGGVAGYGVALVSLNDDDDAAKAARQALKMDVDKDVVGVIGPLSRATARAAGKPLADAGLAWITPSSVGDEVLTEFQGGFRLYASDIALAEEAIGQAMATDPRGMGEPLAVGSMGEFGKPLREAAERFGLYRPLETMSETLSSAVLLGGNAEQVAEELILLGRIEGAVVAGPEAGRAVVTQRAGGAAEGLIWVGSLSPADPAALPADFVDGYQELAGGPPGPLAVLAYDATNVLLDAIDLDIRRNGEPTRPGVMEAMKAVRREGLSGFLEFDAEGSWLDAPVYAHRVAGDDLYAVRLPGASLE